jgi:glycosyltransferase involved in cell wall biosynthesis
MADEMVAFARLSAKTIPGPTLFLTPQPEKIGSLGRVQGWADIRTVEPGAVAGWLRRARALFFFIRAIPSKRASCPTKFAEALACGLPVVCNRGIGDLDAIVERENVGILVDDFSEEAYARAALRLARLLADPYVSERCRRLAEVCFSVELGVARYHELYFRIATAAHADQHRVASR